MTDADILIIGANGQLGRALQAKYPGALAVDMDELDISNQSAVANFDWQGIKIILNAAAYTNVDGAETPAGRIAAEAANALAPKYLAAAATNHDLILVHISTDYVFDGHHDSHTETESYNPLNVYGQTKAQGDRAVASTPKHYILRTSWVIGDGKNFVRTMLELGQKGVNPSVVSDQIGRLTFTDELVRAIDHLLTSNAPYGTYNLTNTGPPASWADITRKIYEFAGLASTVTGLTTAEYYKDKPQAAKRPLKSTLDLSKIKATGFLPEDWQVSLKRYVEKEIHK